MTIHKNTKVVKTQAQRGYAGRLELLDDERNFAYGVMLGLTSHGIAFATKLKQVLGFHLEEVERTSNGNPGSPKYLGRLHIIRLMALHLVFQHYDTLKAKRTRNEPWTDNDRNTTRFLTIAISDLNDGQEDLEECFERPHSKDRMQDILDNFYEVSKQEAEADAAAIQEYIAEAARKRADLEHTAVTH